MKTVMMAVVVVCGFTCALASGEAFAAKRAPMAVSGVVNLNTATEKQLDSLPGVGAKQAKGIVAYRAAHPFARAEEIVKVKGFGKKKYDKLKAHLTVSGPSTLSVTKLEAKAEAAPQGRAAPAGR